MKFPSVTVPSLVTGQEGEEVLERVLHCLSELFGHEAGSTVEEVLGQDGTGRSSGGDKMGPRVLVGTEQVPALRNPPAEKQK